MQESFSPRRGALVLLICVRGLLLQLDFTVIVCLEDLISSERLARVQVVCRSAVCLENNKSVSLLISLTSNRKLIVIYL